MYFDQWEEYLKKENRSKKQNQLCNKINKMILGAREDAGKQKNSTQSKGEVEDYEKRS